MSELQLVVQKDVELVVSLVKRADTSLRLRQSLEVEWLSVKRRPRWQNTEYVNEIERIHELAIAYSKWIKENPETGSAVFKSALTDPEMNSRDAKIIFARKLLRDRNERLHTRIPKFETIVLDLEQSVNRLSGVVNSRS